MAKKDRERKLFNIYITDGLKAISEGISSICGGKCLSKRYYDLLMPPKPVKENEDQIIDRIKNKLKDLGE